MEKSAILIALAILETHYTNEAAKDMLAEILMETEVVYLRHYSSQPTSDVDISTLKPKDTPNLEKTGNLEKNSGVGGQ